QELKIMQPDVTLMGGCCGSAVDATLLATEIGYAYLAASIRRASKTVILIEDDSGIDKSPTDCLLRRGATLKTCLTAWPYKAAHTGFPSGFPWSSNDALQKVGHARGFGFLDTRGWFCDG